MEVDRHIVTREATDPEPAKANGPAAAATLAAGIGIAFYGLVTVLVEMSPTVKALTNWWAPAGPLTGKTGYGVIAWLISWLGLGRAWGARNVDFDKVWKWSLGLIIVGLVLTFPPVFLRFER